MEENVFTYLDSLDNDKVVLSNNLQAKGVEVLSTDTF